MAKEEGADRRLVGFEFFKVLLPGGSRSKLRLPYKFAVELQKQGKIRHAKLRTPRGGRLWDVRVGGSGMALCLADGWEEFAKAHDLQYMVLFLLFRYDGDEVFTVKVFDESECPRDDFLAVGGGGEDAGSC